MADDAIDENDGKIVERDVQDLVRCLNMDEGHFAFLIGAGTSKAAGISTANDLIEQWQREEYHGSDDEPENYAEFQEWVEEKEAEEMKEHDNKYGFWFEQRYASGSMRRNFIQERVENKEPTFGIITLAAMMSQGFVPVTLTPNFDDLLYDAFHFFLEEKPLVINHDALAPQFRLTEERPTTIKLHGDYLYDNLQNTAVETERLEKNMEKVLKKSLKEYGLVVVGYGGNDNSIMDVLKKYDIQSFGLWWCVLEDGGKESLSKEARNLLQQGSNRFLVKISGSEDLFTILWNELDISNPRPGEIIEKAEERADKLRDKYEERKGEETGEEKQALEDLTAADEVFQRALKFDRENKNKKAIKAYTKAIELDPEYAAAYNNRGTIYDEL